MNSILKSFNQPGFFRFSLAFFVVIFHATDFIKIGHYPVYLFFILSGYWITRIYNEKYNYFTQKIRIYYLSRIWRLFPVYFIILIIGIVANVFKDYFESGLIRTISFDLRTYLLNLEVLGLNFSNKIIIVPAWSLDIELQFYLFVPLIIYFINKKFIKPALFLSLSVIFSMFILFYDLKIFSNTFLKYYPYFLIGLCIFYYDIRFSKFISYTFLLLAMALWLINYLFLDFNNFFLNINLDLYNINFIEILSSIMVVFTIPFVTINIHQKIINKKMDKVLSSMSYVIYLLHWPILQIYSLFAKNEVGINKAFLFVIYLITSFFFSLLISLLIDLRLENLRSLWIKLQKSKNT
jgi:peptidoglycan/LPS O-acetylase OafA/YrhL